MLAPTLPNNTVNHTLTRVALSLTYSNPTKVAEPRHTSRTANTTYTLQRARTKVRS